MQLFIAFPTGRGPLSRMQLKSCEYISESSIIVLKILKCHLDVKWILLFWINMFSAYLYLKIEVIRHR